MSDYYTIHLFSADLVGERLRFAGKPGVWSWDAVDPGTRLLAETVEVPPGGHVLDLGCGTGLLGAWLARRGAEVTLADANVPAVACAARTLAANGLDPARAVLAEGVPPGAYDVIAAHLPRGTALAERLIHEAGAALRLGGRLYLAGHKLSGIKTFVDRAARRFGAAPTLKIKAGFRVAVATKNRPMAPPAGDGYASREVVLRGEPAQLIARPGVFAWEGLDPGTAALVEHMDIPAGADVLDLGCGAGLAGLAAARLTRGRVVLVDADARALAAARRTLAANGAIHAEVVASDCAQAVLDQRFDRVISNPPFHQGRSVDDAVARQFIRDARAVLRPDGQLFLVANAFLPYEAELAELFGAVETVFRDRKFKVLSGEARPPAPLS